jgi:hypothetical protein
MDQKVVTAGLVPGSLRHLHDGNAGHPMGASLSYRGNVSATDSRIDDPRPRHFNPRLHDVSHGPDSHRLAGARDLQINPIDARIAFDSLQHFVCVDL